MVAKIQLSSSNNQSGDYHRTRLTWSRLPLLWLLKQH